MKPSLPAPEPYETMRIMSPGLAMSSVAVSPSGDAPEYVFPSLRDKPARLDLLFLEAQHLARAQRKLAVGLMEDDILRSPQGFMPALAMIPFAAAVTCLK